MSTYNKNTWNQLKNTTAQDLLRALQRDGWEQEVSSGAIQGFVSPDKKNRITIHVHPKKTYGAGLLKGLLDDIGWTEKDLKRLKLIK